MNTRKLTIAAAVILILAVAAWAFGFFRGDPVVAEMQQLQEQMFANRDLPDGERRAQWDSFRERMEGLTDAQRAALRDAGRQRWQQFGEQRMDEFFQLPPDQQRQRLDEIIDRMEARQGDQARNPNAGRGGRGDRGANLSDAQRTQRAKERLDRTSAKSRAQRNEFRRQLNERRAERGLPPSKGGRGGRGGPWRS